MRALLDHNLPHKLRTALAAISAHELVTASFLGWGDLKNGELLRAAEQAMFDTFVTGGFVEVDCGVFSRKEDYDHAG